MKRKKNEKNCYTCKKRRENCKEFPRNVCEWLDFVCADYKPRKLGKVILDQDAANA